MSTIHVKIVASVEGHSCKDDPDNCVEGSVPCAIWRSCMGKVKSSLVSPWLTDRVTERAYLIAKLRDVHADAVRGNDGRLALDALKALADVMKSE